MKDFAVTLKNQSGQVFGVNGAYILSKEKPMQGCTNRWRFELPDNQIMEIIIVESQKSGLAVICGHYKEVLKAHIRRFGNSLTRI